MAAHPCSSDRALDVSMQGCLQRPQEDTNVLSTGSYTTEQLAG
jgi:hypothetical protein